jgi:hypothetical protein
MNEHLAKELLARIDAALAKPWTPPTPEEQYGRDRCRCYKCKRVMEASEPVWRDRVCELQTSLFSVWGLRHPVFLSRLRWRCLRAQ